MVSAMNAGRGIGPDVIVVGSGPSGVSAAWPLVEAGLKVLMIDASDAKPLPGPLADDIGAFRADSSRWAQQFGRDPAGLGIDGDYSPKLTTPRARGALDGFAATADVKATGFAALGSLAQGGLSTIWGALVTVFDDEDLIGYPIKRNDLEPSYQAVMARIGVSGGRPSGGVRIDDGPPLSEPAAKLLDHYQRRGSRHGLSLQRATNAVLMSERSTRKPCNSSGLCLWGCQRGSIYNSAFEIPALTRFANFEYRPGMLVHRVLPGPGGHVLDIESDGRTLVAAGHVVLAAGTLVTTGLVMRRLALRDDSVRLLSNPLAAMAFVMPRYVGLSLPGRSFALGQLVYRIPLGERGHAGGVIYGADTLPLQGIAGRLPLARPVALRLARALAPALLLATCYLPSRFSNNRLYLQHRRDGASVIVEGEQTPEAKQLLRNAAKRLARSLRPLGAVALPASLTLAPPGSDVHYAGTLPMGTTGKFGCSVTGELNNCPGLYIVDGSILPELPAKHCTLSIMANADRIGRYLVGKLAAGARW
jgi:choline dehydrogenase-like flavoprotein